MARRSGAPSASKLPGQPSGGPGRSKSTPVRRSAGREYGDGSSAASGALTLVATPIGNLGDITLRGVEALRQADVVACEDTRVTAKLLHHLGLATPMAPYHEHNAEAAGRSLLARMRAGAKVALVSDAGTPLLSDPGFALVRDCLADGIPVTGLPGASAALTALQLSGLPAERFLFAGFQPPKTAGRRAALALLANVPASLIFYESAPRLAASLADMAAAFGPRAAAVARELTKLHEEVRRGDLATLAAHYAEAGPPRGEITIVVGPPGAAEAPTEDALDARLAEALSRASLKAAVAEVAAVLDLPRRDVYVRALALQGKA